MYIDEIFLVFYRVQQQYYNTIHLKCHSIKNALRNEISNIRTCYTPLLFIMFNIQHFDEMDF